MRQQLREIDHTLAYLFMLLLAASILVIGALWSIANKLERIAELLHVAQGAAK